MLLRRSWLLLCLAESVAQDANTQQFDSYEVRIQSWVRHVRRIGVDNKSDRPWVIDFFCFVPNMTDLTLYTYLVLCRTWIVVLYVTKCFLRKHMIRSKVHVKLGAVTVTPDASTRTTKAGGQSGDLWCFRKNNWIAPASQQRMLLFVEL